MPDILFAIKYSDQQFIFLVSTYRTVFMHKGPWQSEFARQIDSCFCMQTE